MPKPGGPCSDGVREQYAFVLKQIRSVRASLVTPSLSPDSVESRLTVSILRIDSALEKYGRIFSSIEGYSESKLRAQILRLEQSCYKKFVYGYLNCAEEKFLELSNELRAIGSSTGYRYDGTDRTFAEGVRFFRASIRCYQIARSKGVVFDDEIEINGRLRQLLFKVQGFLLPSIDCAVTIGVLSAEPLAAALEDADRGKSYPQFDLLGDSTKERELANRISHD